MSALPPVSAVRSQSQPELKSEEDDEGMLLIRARSQSSDGTHLGQQSYERIKQLLAYPVTRTNYKKAKEILNNRLLWSHSPSKGAEKLGTSYRDWSNSLQINYREKAENIVLAAKRVLKTAKNEPAFEPLSFSKLPPSEYADNSKKLNNL